ncbi:MAG: hypothetical protein N2B06_16895 [Clostridium sp.]
MNYSIVTAGVVWLAFASAYIFKYKKVDSETSLFKQYRVLFSGLFWGFLVAVGTYYTLEYVNKNNLMGQGGGLFGEGALPIDGFGQQGPAQFEGFGTEASFDSSSDLGGYEF